MECFYQRDIASIRKKEFPTLHGVNYLDHGGTTLYAQSLITRFADDMRHHLFGNPHSASPSSQLSTQWVEDVRLKLLAFFKADTEEFDLIFVANATAAIKLVLDALRDLEDGFWYGFHRDAHTSIVGLRELAAETKCFESDNDVEEWIRGGCVRNSTSAGTCLFAYPAQSNMNGHRTPLSWSSRIRSSSHQKIYTLLDAAAYAMTAQLDLSDGNSAPDFTVLSFYKIFGFPDLGALIVRKSTGKILRRRHYFGGGTVDMVIALQKPWHATKDKSLHEQLEDGTLPFHHIIALDSALKVHEELYGCMENISKHTCRLALSLYNRLSSLRHANGRQLCIIYKDPTSQYGNAKTQGPTVAFNLQNSQGGWIGKSDVEKLAILHGIHLRTGGVCNPGGIATFCQLASWELRRNFSEGMRCGDDLDVLGGKPTGIVRVSLGAMSSLEDVEKFVDFLEDMFVDTQAGPFKPTHAPLTDSLLSVEKLQIFPVAGCQSWQVPELVRWQFGPTGLAWDQEWCIISPDGRPLDPDVHPRMKTIKPYLDLEKGILRLTTPKIVSSPVRGIQDVGTESEELTISTWYTPSTSDITHMLASSGHRAADPLNSPVVSNFFMTVLGVPCTLARYRHPGRVAKYAGCPADISVHNVPITLAASGPNPSSNISISGVRKTSPLSLSEYLRIGPHLFQILTASTIESSPSLSLRYLCSPQDCTPSSQNPTLSASDPIQQLPGPPLPEPDLAVAIHSSASTTSIPPARPCPVWDCCCSFTTSEDLHQHLNTHILKNPMTVKRKLKNLLVTWKLTYMKM